MRETWSKRYTYFELSANLFSSDVFDIVTINDLRALAMIKNRYSYLDIIITSELE